MWGLTCPRAALKSAYLKIILTLRDKLGIFGCYNITTSENIVTQHYYTL